RRSAIFRTRHFQFPRPFRRRFRSLRRHRRPHHPRRHRLHCHHQLHHHRRHLHPFPHQLHGPPCHRIPTNRNRHPPHFQARHGLRSRSRRLILHHRPGRIPGLGCRSRAPARPSRRRTRRWRAYPPQP